MGFLSKIGNALSGAAGDIAGGVIGGLFTSSAQQDANRQNVKLQREQRQWEEMMSNTAVQRRMKDLELAGVNPLLGMGPGFGADVPNVSPARVESTGRERGELLARGTSSAVNHALQQRQLTTAIENMKADTRLKDAETGLIPAKADQIRSTIDNITADTDKKELESAHIILQNGLLELNTTQVAELLPHVIAYKKAIAESAQISAKEKAMRLEVLESWIGQASLYAERIIPSLNAAGGLIGGVSLLKGAGKLLRGRGLSGGRLPKNPFGKNTGFFDKSTGEIFNP